MYRKPRADLYTVMLIIALMAIVVSCVFLYLELPKDEYPDSPPWSGGPSARLDSVHPAAPGSNTGRLVVAGEGRSPFNCCFRIPLLG